MPSTNWDQLIVERRAAPPMLDGDRFRAWMAGRRVFISSTMDAEMTPARVAVARYLREHGAVPVLWEGITPQDRRAQDAYLDGVDTSQILVLLLGARYGQTDDTGYTPTHKETNRARDIGIPRLLFERVLPASERDGRLNDWLRSLYAELSGAQYSAPDDLVQQLDQRLREIAGSQDSHWIKLGNVVFPGTVRQRREQTGATFRIAARLHDPPVRRAVAALWQGAGGYYSGSGGLQLTWGDQTHAVRVDTVEVHSGAVSADDVDIVCSAAGHLQQHASAALGGITFSGPGGSVGPAEQAVMWADRALFGIALQRSPRDQLVAGFVAPDGPTLPEVLSAAGARGWLAEGLTRLYAIEGLAAKFGGHFEALEIGPATAAAVRVHGRYRLSFLTDALVEIRGSVPLRPVPA